MVKFGRKFFFDTKHSKKRRIITYIIAGVAIILFIIILALIIRAINQKKPKPKPAQTEIVLRTELKTEIYSALPDKTAYFEKLENFNLDNITITYPPYLPLEKLYDNCSDDEMKILEEIANGKDPANYDNPEACVEYMPTGIGAYDVTVNYNDKDYTVTLNVDDTQAPTLVVKNLEIVEGQTYSAKDFVESCVDNSKKECTYDYYYKEYSPNVNYGNYTEPGTYEIAIVAIDGSSNKTVPENVTLIITEKQIQVFTVTFNSNGGSTVGNQYINEGEKATAPATPTKSGYTFAGWYTSGTDKFNFDTPITSDITLVAKWNKNKQVSDPKPKTTCSNGNLNYDKKKYPTLALKVSDGNCAISTSNLTYLTKGSSLHKMMSQEAEKLKTWQTKNNVEYCIRIVNDKPQAVLNTSGKGVVGYTVEFSIVSAKIQNGKCMEPTTEVARYFLNEKGQRVFSLNLINLPKS